MEARSSDAALHHSPSWSNSPYTAWRCVGVFVLLKYTCGDHPFTHTASHKDMAFGTKNLKFGLQTKGQISTDLMSLLVFLGPSKSLLLIGVL